MGSRRQYIIPYSLNTQNVAEVARQLWELPTDEELFINFEQMQHAEPFGYLVLGAAVRDAKRRWAAANRQLRIVGRDDRQQGHQFAKEMGFWWSIGEDPSKLELPEATDKYVRIASLTIAELYRSSGGLDPVRSGSISRIASQLAAVLAQGNSGPTWAALEYSIREMLRNAVEHGKRDCWIAGWARYRIDPPDVQVAILDEGQGIRSSLCENPLYKPPNDFVAIELALEPGVSRNSGKQRTPQETQMLREQFPGTNPEDWDNSGYGLTLATELARKSGQCAILSGSACIAWTPDKHRTLTHLDGTAVRLSFEPARLRAALKETFKDRVFADPRRSSQSMKLAED